MTTSQIQLEQVSRMLDKAWNMPPTPKNWWLFTIRTTLWMSRAAAGKRAWVSSIAWLLAEKREVKWTISISTMDKFLKALWCSFSYLPFVTDSLENTIKKQALIYSNSKMRSVISTMSLENQKPSNSLTDLMRKKQAEDIFRSGNWKDIWQ